MVMTKQYTCDLCKKVFNQKIDFTRHQNKKTPCISLTEMQKITKTKENKLDIKTKLVNVMHNCLDILRPEGLTSDKALRNVSYFLILKLIEPHFGNDINIDDYEYVANSGDLDECNGMTVNGQYGYYVTESYPWVIACFSGTPASSFNK